MWIIDPDYTRPVLTKSIVFSPYTNKILHEVLIYVDIIDIRVPSIKLNYLYN